MCDHEKHMRRAIGLSRERMRAKLGGPFGAIIVRNGQILAKGYNMVTSANDPTAHAEVVAIREACKKLNAFSLEGCVIYSSCEPCPMCLASIYWARLDALYFANTRDDAAAIGFDDEFLYREIPKPIAARSLKTVRLDMDEAVEVFEEWQKMPDKIMY